MHSCGQSVSDIPKSVYSPPAWSQSSSVMHVNMVSNALPKSRGLHSSTSQLNISAFCWIGDTFKGCVGGIQEVFRGCLGGVQEVLGGIRG